MKIADMIDSKLIPDGVYEGTIWRAELEEKPPVNSNLKVYVRLRNEKEFTDTWQVISKNQQAQRKAQSLLTQWSESCGVENWDRETSNLLGLPIKIHVGKFRRSNGIPQNCVKAVLPA